MSDGQSNDLFHYVPNRNNQVAAATTWGCPFRQSLVPAEPACPDCPVGRYYGAYAVRCLRCCDLSRPLLAQPLSCSRRVTFADTPLIRAASGPAQSRPLLQGPVTDGH